MVYVFIEHNKGFKRISFDTIENATKALITVDIPKDTNSIRITVVE